jgi:hypothetical protein
LIVRFKKTKPHKINIYQNYIKFNLAKVIAFVLLFATILSLLLYFNTTDPRLSSLISGLASGFVLATIQFFFSWYDYVKIDKYQKMQIKDIRPDRDNRSLYESLIKGSKHEILILGATASRLVNDFADSNSNNDQNKVLLTALSKGVSVKVLLPELDFLEAQQQPKFALTKARFEEIQKQYPKFVFKYFSHPPYHSMFLVDNNCIVGPMFPGVSSKNTPSIYVETSSPFAKTYIDYFNSEWQ